ncbi:MAG: hypothetical protein RLY95_1938 [Pseudomonadota bacterium]|jgi:uncharacterized protein
MVSKYVLILVILVAAIFIWRSNRKVAAKERKATEQRAKVIDMQPCRWCAVHIPTAEAVQGKHGSYCSLAHRLKAEP